MLHCSESYQIFWISCLPNEKKKNTVYWRNTRLVHTVAREVTLFPPLQWDRFSLTCSSSIPASWLTAWRAEEANAELSLGWALQQQGLAVLHDVSTHLGTEDSISQVTDNGVLMNIHSLNRNILIRKPLLSCYSIAEQRTKSVLCTWPIPCVSSSRATLRYQWWFHL